MADPFFSLELVTPAAGVQKLPCECLTVTLCDGEAAFMKNHAPFLGALPAGVIKVRLGENIGRWEIGEAFLQIDGKGAAIFTDKCRKLS